MIIIELVSKAFGKITKKGNSILDKFILNCQSNYCENRMTFCKRFFDLRAEGYKELIALEYKNVTGPRKTEVLGKIEEAHRYMETVLREMKEEPEPFLNTSLFVEKSDFTDFVRQYLSTHRDDSEKIKSRLEASPEKPTGEQIEEVLRDYRNKRAKALLEEAHARETIKGIDEELKQENQSSETRLVLITKKYALSAKYFEVESGVLGEGFYGKGKNPNESFDYNPIFSCILKGDSKENAEFRNNYWALKTQEEAGKMLQSAKLEVEGVQVFRCISYLTAARFTTVEAFGCTEEMRQASEMNSMLTERAKAMIKDYSDKRNLRGKNE